MLIKKSISLTKHRTSLSLEKEFWDSLELIAKKKNCSLQQLISEIDVERKSSLASSTRVFVLENFKNFNP